MKSLDELVIWTETIIHGFEAPICRSIWFPVQGHKRRFVRRQRIEARFGEKIRKLQLAVSYCDGEVNNISLISECLT